MNGTLNRLAPSRSKQREPITGTTEVVNSHYTATGVIGGNSAGPAKGWEVIQPNHHNKPKALIHAQAALQEAWLNYLWLIDNKPEEWAAQNEAWEQYDTAKRLCEQEYDAWCNGYEF